MHVTAGETFECTINIFERQIGILIFHANFEKKNFCADLQIRTLRKSDILTTEDGGLVSTLKKKLRPK